MLTAGILTVSDKGSRGERMDGSGEEIKNLIATLARLVRYDIVPDEKDIIASRLAEWADSSQIDVIFTTGGTGLARRDVTPEATLSIIEKQVPGLGEAMRAGTARFAPTAILSRAVAGTRGGCLIINLPGSPKAVRQCLEVILPVIPHAVDILKGTVTEHTESGKA